MCVFREGRNDMNTNILIDGETGEMRLVESISVDHRYKSYPVPSDNETRMALELGQKAIEQVKINGYEICGDPRFQTLPADKQGPTLALRVCSQLIIPVHRTCSTRKPEDDSNANKA